MGIIINSIVEFWQLIIDLSKSFILKDLIDISIVTLLIYSAIKLLRETRAVQLIKGLLVLIVIYVASILLNLEMVNTITTFFFQYAVVTILVVFQPEIRKALEQMGRSNVGKSIFSVVSSKDDESTALANRIAINSTVNAIVSLQALKMGAIIVFEKVTKLGEIIETGTTVDAQPSAQMIGNIFFNKAPLHDGAMIIRNGRVAAAGCILPLTKSDSLSESLGTRHRASVGLSEECDAVVVVLSEETGQISIAYNGVLKRDFTKEELRDFLDNNLNTKTEDSHLPHSKIPLFNRKRGDKK
ncbi:MAG: diadenylate cyclase CdaA [Clostridia bacterium]